MTSHATSYESVSSRGHVGPGLPLNALSLISLPGIGWRALNQTSNPIDHPLIPFSGFNPLRPPIRSVIFRTITDDAGEISVGLGWAENEAVLLDGTPLSNGTNLIDTTAGFGSGRLAPEIRINAGSDVATALAALSGTTTDLDINADAGYIDETYMGMQHFCEFQEQPPNTAAVGHDRLTELLNLFEVSAARFQIAVDAAGAPVYVEQAGFCGLDPSGVVYIRPEDLGPGPLQIPVDMTDNTAANFRAHPSVFFPSGKSQYVRAITRQRTDPTELNSGDGSQPIKIVSVGSAVITSAWLVTIDGAPMVIRVNHPVGSDLRRPRDIWANVILPLINDGGANQGNVIYPTVANSVGDAVLSRLAYADYWRCLPIAGTTIIQDGGGG